MESGQEIFLVTQRELNTDRPGEKDLYTIGTISRVTQILRLGKTSLRVMVEGENPQEIETIANEVADVVRERLA